MSIGFSLFYYLFIHKKNTSTRLSCVCTSISHTIWCMCRSHKTGTSLEKGCRVLAKGFGGNGLRTRFVNICAYAWCIRPSMVLTGKRVVGRWRVSCLLRIRRSVIMKYRFHLYPFSLALYLSPHVRYIPFMLTNEDDLSAVRWVNFERDRHTSLIFSFSYSWTFPSKRPFSLPSFGAAEYLECARRRSISTLVHTVTYWRK